MLQAKHVDATRGSLVRAIILYTVPLIFSTLIQSLFNAVDIVVLGNMASSNAVASVGATTTINHLIVNTFVGLSGGTKIILARQVGAEDRDGARKTVEASLLSALGLGIVILIAGMFLSPLFLDLTNCPTECFDGAVLYLRIYILAAPAVLLYNFGAAILRACGDTQRPLYYIVLCGLLNVILNVILCLILPQKVAAVAIATAASQYLGAFLVIRRLCVVDDICKLVLSKIRWHTASFVQIMRYGIPLALTQALYPLANLQIQSAINSYGVSAVAGSSAAITVESFPSSFSGAFGTTVTAFMGQNLGAEKHDRVKRSFWDCLIMSVTVGLIMGIFFHLTGRFWLRFILTDDLLAVEYAMIRSRFVTLFIAVSAANGVLSHAIQSFGYPTFSAVNSISFVFVFRMIWMLTVYPKHQTFEWLMLCFTISWSLMLLFNIAMFSVIYKRYAKGKYKKI